MHQASNVTEEDQKALHRQLAADRFLRVRGRDRDVEDQSVSSTGDPPKGNGVGHKKRGTRKPMCLRARKCGAVGAAVVLLGSKTQP